VTTPLCFFDTETNGLRADRGGPPTTTRTRSPSSAAAPTGPGTNGGAGGCPSTSPWPTQAPWPRPATTSASPPLPVGNGGRQLVIRPQRGRWLTLAEAAAEIARITAGTVLIGINPSFDADMLTAALRDQGECGAWQHRHQDARVFAAGALTGRGITLGPPPWSTEPIATALRLDLAAYELHTAMGDAHAGPRPLRRRPRARRTRWHRDPGIRALGRPERADRGAAPGV
jgi:hypothetical protein